MPRIFIAALAACASLTAFGVGTANADEETNFLFDLQANGFTNGNGAAVFIDQGRGICQRLSEGETVDHLALNIWEQTRGATDLRSAWLFISIATKNLCPAYSAGARDALLAG